MVVFLILLFGMFYFLIIRPQRRRQKEHNELTASLKRGARIVTIGGVFGQIESVTDENFVIKVESGATLRMAKGSVAFKQEDLDKVKG
jgi:preprotein translocase subunit YajC